VSAGQVGGLPGFFLPLPGRFAPVRGDAPSSLCRRFTHPL